jgi:hypothetical protein
VSSLAVRGALSSNGYSPAGVACVGYRYLRNAEPVVLEPGHHHAASSVQRRLLDHSPQSQRFARGESVVRMFERFFWHVDGYKRVVDVQDLEASSLERCNEVIHARAVRGMAGWHVGRASSRRKAQCALGRTDHKGRQSSPADQAQVHSAAQISRGFNRLVGGISRFKTAIRARCATGSCVATNCRRSM